MGQSDNAHHHETSKSQFHCPLWLIYEQISNTILLKLGNDSVMISFKIIYTFLGKCSGVVVGWMRWFPFIVVDLKCKWIRSKGAYSFGTLDCNDLHNARFDTSLSVWQLRVSFRLERCVSYDFRPEGQDEGRS